MLAWLATATTLVIGTALAIGIEDNRDWPPVAEILSVLPFFMSLVVATAASLAVIVWSVIWMVRPSQPGPNRYGAEPRSTTPSPVP